MNQAQDVSPELSLDVMRLMRDFFESDDARAALESWGRKNRRELWDRIEGFTAEIDMPAVVYLQTTSVMGADSMIALFEETLTEEASDD